MRRVLLSAMMALAVFPAAAGGDEWTHPYWIACQAAAGNTAAFRKVVRFASRPVKCYVTVSATDLKDYRAEVKYVIYLNGQKVAQRQAGGAGAPAECPWYDATAMVAAENVLAVEIECGRKEAVPAFNLELDCWFEPPRRLMERSDASWRCCWPVPPDAVWRDLGFRDSSWALAREIGRKWGTPRPSGGWNRLPSTMPKIRTATAEKFGRLVDLQVKQCELNIVPRPHRLKLLTGETLLGSKTQLPFRIAIAADHPPKSHASTILAEALRHLTGLSPAVQTWQGPEDKLLVLAVGKSPASWVKQILGAAGVSLSGLGNEGFAIVPYEDRGKRGFLLAAPDESGLCHAACSFIQLLRKQGDEVLARRAQVVDWPDTPVRGLIGEQWETEVAWLSFYGFNRVFVNTNVADPIDPALCEFVAFLREWGIEPVFYIHPAADFCFSNPAHVRIVTAQMAAARRAGFREVTLQADDFPGHPTLQDAQAYGEGLAGLAQAHLAFLRAVLPIAVRLGLHLDFCPSVYSPGSSPTADEYLRIVSDVPREVDMFTTCRQAEWLAKLARPWPMFWSNELMDRTYTGIRFFVEYPPVPAETASRLRGAWVMTHAFGINRANTLCYLNNWWNLAAPLALKVALKKEWGMPAATYLDRYAEAIGLRTQWRPEMNIYAPSAPALDSMAPVHSDAALDAPSQTNLALLRKRAEEATRAKAVDWSGSGIDPKTIAELCASARRIEALYTLLGDWMELKLTATGGLPGGRDHARQLNQRIAVDVEQLKKLGASDYVLYKLRSRWTK